MLRSFIISAILASSVPLLAEESALTQAEVIAHIEAQNRSSNEAYAVFSLGKASSNPEHCERETTNAFAINRADHNAADLFLQAATAFVNETIVRFELKGCVDGYPQIVKIIRE